MAYCRITATNDGLNMLYFRSTRLLTFPDYLVVQVKKFTVGEDWVPKKLGTITGSLNRDYLVNKTNIHGHSLMKLGLKTIERMEKQAVIFKLSDETNIYRNT